MSDVIWAAAIAVGGSGITGTIALLGTRFAAIETTRREARRLSSEHREADRQVRRDTYANFLANIEELDTLTSACTPDPSPESWTAWIWRHRTATVAIRLVESPSVRDARRAWTEVFDKLTPQVMAGLENGRPIKDALGYPYIDLQPDLRVVGRALGDAMQADLGFDEPAPQANVGVAGAAVASGRPRRTRVRVAWRPMGNAGSAHARFEQALWTGNLLIIIDAAARELPQVSLTDALQILRVMAEQHDDRYDRAAARWAARVFTERRLSLTNSRRVLALVEILPDAPEAVVVRLQAYCA